jgi:hypothetical protein
MIISFDESTHSYTINGDFADASVTELLGKHGLAPDFTKVAKDVRIKAAAQGKLIHEDIEKLVNGKEEHKPTTLQGEQFAEWLKENVEGAIAEQPTGYIIKNRLFAGTADLVGVTKDGKFFIGDHKCTSKFEREYVSWQVSLYDYFLRHVGGNHKINGKSWAAYKGADLFYCFHYNVSKGEFKVYQLEKVPDGEIEKLLDCEINGKKYHRPTLVVESDLLEQWQAAETALVEMEQAYQKQQEQVKEFRQRLCEEMERQGIETFESGKLRLRYVRATETLTTDTKALKARYPQIYSELQRIVRKKAYVRVSIKGEDDDDEYF